MPIGQHSYSIVLLCWIVFALVWFVSSLFVKRSVTRQGPGWIVWRFAVVLAIVAYVRLERTAGSNVRPLRTLFHSSFAFPMLGTTLTVLGLAGAVWARVYLGTNWSGYATHKEHHVLVTTGPYALVRHPIYTSMLLMFTGTTLYYGSWLLAANYAVLAVAFVWRARNEEAIMTNLFGDRYADYVRRSRRFIPWLY